MESFWRDIVTLHQIQQGIHKIYIINVGPGNVDRDIDGLQALFVPLLHQLADLFPHILVQLGDEAVSLKKRDENRRGLHAPFRMAPAHQSLGIGEKASGRLVFRLELHLELSLLQRLLHAVQDRLIPKHLTSKLIIIEGIIPAVLALDASRPLERPVAHLLHGNLPVSSLIDTPLDDDVADAAFFPGLCRQSLIQFVTVSFRMLNHADKLIRMETAADTT